MGCLTIPGKTQTYLAKSVRFLEVLAVHRAGQSPGTAFGAVLGIQQPTGDGSVLTSTLLRHSRHRSALASPSLATQNGSRSRSHVLPHFPRPTAGFHSPLAVRQDGGTPVLASGMWVELHTRHCQAWPLKPPTRPPCSPLTHLPPKHRGSAGRSETQAGGGPQDSVSPSGQTPPLHGSGINEQ